MRKPTKKGSSVPQEPESHPPILRYSRWFPFSPTPAAAAANPYRQVREPVARVMQTNAFHQLVYGRTLPVQHCTVDAITLHVLPAPELSTRLFSKYFRQQCAAKPPSTQRCQNVSAEEIRHPRLSCVRQKRAYRAAPTLPRKNSYDGDAGMRNETRIFRTLAKGGHRRKLLLKRDPDCCETRTRDACNLVQQMI